MDVTGSVLKNRYKIEEKIAESNFSTIYRALDTSNRKPVAIKILSGNTNRPEERIRFITESDILSRINHPNIVTIFEAGILDGFVGMPRYFLATDYIKGKTLDEYVSRSLSIDCSINILSKVCEALTAIHEKQLIHGDLKPQNIMIADPDRLDVKLVDFGLSRFKNREDLDRKTDIQGTFQYMSPEQIGLLRSRVDERSDLYSLGIIGYQLLTGNHPFNTANLSTLLHEQVARRPEKLSRTRHHVPEVLDAMILKLLEKEPDLRYQSAQGLGIDLKRIINGDHEFAAGQHDTAGMRFSTRLIGRHEELVRFKKLLSLVRDGQGATCFLAGEPGIGKTRLLDEFRKHAISNKITVVEGRCLERDSKMPWGLFRDILSGYLKTFQRYSAPQKTLISQSLQKNCKHQGSIILQINPAYKEILKDCPAVAKLSPEQEMIRSCAAFTHFIYALARAEGSIVVLLDDLQWADTGSLKLLEETARNISDYPLLFFGTYRSNEVDESHELYPVMHPPEKRYNPRHIRIDALDSESIETFISSLMNTKPSWLKSLAGHVHTRSQGNPFHTLQILTHLITEGVLLRTPNDWSLDLDRLERIQVPEDLLSILLQRMKRLSSADIDLLCQAALIGRRFDISLLFQLHPGEENSKRIIKTLNKAVAHQLIEESFIQKGEMIFVHDRIRESFYSRLSSERLKSWHHDIGRAIESLHRNKDLSAVMFDLAYHFIESRDPDKILEYAYPAARQAYGEYDYDDAIRYFVAVQAALEQKGQSHYDAWLGCTEELAVACMNARKGDDALILLNKLLPCMTTRLKKARIYLYMSQANYLVGALRKTEKFAKKGLGLLNERLPVTKTGVFLGSIKELCIHCAYQLLPFVFQKKDNRDVKEKYRLKAAFYYTLFPVYNFYEMWKLPRIILRRLNISENSIGPSRELGLSLLWYSVVSNVVRCHSRAFKTAKRAYAMGKDLNDEWLIAYASNSIGFAYICTGDYHTAKKYYKKNLYYFSQTRELVEFLISAKGLSVSTLELAHFQEIKNIDRLCREMVTNRHDEIYLSYTRPQVLVDICCGNFNRAEQYLLSRYEMIKSYSFEFCVRNIWLGKLYLEKGDFKKALSFLEIAEKLDQENNFMQYLVTELHHLIPDALLKDFLEEQHILPLKKKNRSLKIIKKRCLIALKKNRHFPLHYGGALKVNAAYYAVVGEHSKAEGFFGKAITYHETHRQAYKLARVRYSYGIHLKDTGRTIEAQSELEKAYLLFKKIPVPYWMNKTELVLGVSKTGNILVADQIKDRIKNKIDRERIQTVLAFSKALTDCHSFDSLAVQIVSTAMEITGAQAGGLFLSETDFYSVTLKTWKTLENEPAPTYSQTIVDKVFQTGKPLILTNAEEDESYVTQLSVSRHQLKSILCIPLKYNDLINGVCYLSNSLAAGVFTDDDIALLEKFLSQAAIAIENALLNDRLNRRDKEKQATAGPVPIDGNISKVLAHIDRHFQEELTRDGLARICSINPDYLGKSFKAQTGKSIRDYINEKRIQFSADQLLKTDKKIIDIAFDAGFESLRTFNRTFFRFMKDTPSKYRKKVSVDPLL